MPETYFPINERFLFLHDLTQMVITNHTQSLVVLGEGGLGKTYTVTKAIENSGLRPDQYYFIKGYSTARGLYNLLYDHNDKLIIFDDCDSVLEDKTSQNLLKSALDSYDVRRLTWSAKMRSGDEYPQEFDFTGRIIFISNKSREKVFQPILTRSMIVDLKMSPTEKIERMQYIVKEIMPEYGMPTKMKALAFIASKQKICADLSLRTLIKVTKICAAGEAQSIKDWQRLAEYAIVEN